MQEYGISARLTFSNSLLKEEHLSDKRCNALCSLFAQSESLRNGVILHSDLLLDALKKAYPNLYFVSSTTKVLTEFGLFKRELEREDFLYVVPDFRLNKAFDKLNRIREKEKVEFLCNECCWFGCKDRNAVTRQSAERIWARIPRNTAAAAPDAEGGYLFSKAMMNPGLSVSTRFKAYLPMGFSNFKIEGRGLGSALILEFLLYYMTKPAYQLRVREEIYLDNTLDLF